ncbi:MAG: hypothetical protein QW594_02045 [Candidatus Woesearchaeota archaeon]
MAKQQVAQPLHFPNLSKQLGKKAVDIQLLIIILLLVIFFFLVFYKIFTFTNSMN